MRESSLWRQIKKNLPQVDWQRIESGGTAQGIPDVNGCWNGREVWLELKVEGNTLSKWQKQWAKRRRKAGGRVFVIWDRGTHITIEGDRLDYSLVKPIDWALLMGVLFA